MNQFVRIAQRLSVALVLVLTLVTLVTAGDAAAHRRSPADVEAACYAVGGEYYEMWLSDPADPTNQAAGVLTYGCFLPDGSDLECYDLSPYEPACLFNPAPEPETHLGDPLPGSTRPADGELVGQRSAAR